MRIIALTTGEVRPVRKCERPLFSSLETALLARRFAPCLASPRALLHGLGDGTENVVVGVSEDRGTPSSDVVDELVSINVPGVGSLDMIEDHRVAAYGLKGTDGGGDAAGHEGLGLFEDRVGLLEGIGLGRGAHGEGVCEEGEEEER